MGLGSIVGHDLASVPFADMIYQLGCAIARSQFKLDMEGIQILKIMGDKEDAPVYLPNFQLDNNGNGLVSDNNGYSSGNDIVTSMIGAGFQPTFYQFAETIIEIKMTLTMSYDSSYERTTKGNITTTATKTKSNWFSNSSSTVVRTTPVDAKYSSTYSYTAEGSSLMRTRLVPVPPNNFIQKVLDIRAQAMQMEMELELKKLELAMEVEKAKIAAETKKLEEPADDK